MNYKELVSPEMEECIQDFLGELGHYEIQCQRWVYPRSNG